MISEKVYVVGIDGNFTRKAIAAPALPEQKKRGRQEKNIELATL
jgi:hypothetical protein